MRKTFRKKIKGVKDMDKVSYDEYLELVKQQVAIRTGTRVELQKSTKNNGLVMDGLMIVSEGSNVAPMIYLNNSYEEFLEHGIEVVVEQVIAVYEANKEDNPFDFDVSILIEFSKVKPLIKMKLINYEKNVDLLKEVVHRKELDLAVVFMIVLESKENDDLSGTILIRRELFDLWGISEDTLYQVAKDNMKNSFETTSLNSLIYTVMKQFGIEGFPVSNPLFELYVLTTNSRLNGAVGMLQTGLLKAFMQKHKVEQLIIFPSSVHEVLLFPYRSEVAKDNLYEMVREVNETKLEDVDFLSNNVYLFDGESLEIF